MSNPLQNKVRRLSNTCSWLIVSQSIYLLWMFGALMNAGSNTPALMYTMVFVFLVVFFSKFKKSLGVFSSDAQHEHEMVSSIFMFVALALFALQMIVSVYMIAAKGQNFLLAYTDDARAGQLFTKNLGLLALFLVLPLNTLLAGSQFFVRLFRLNKSSQQASYNTLTHAAA